MPGAINGLASLSPSFISFNLFSPFLPNAFPLLPSLVLFSLFPILTNSLCLPSLIFPFCFPSLPNSHPGPSPPFFSHFFSLIFPFIPCAHSHSLLPSLMSFSQFFHFSQIPFLSHSLIYFSLFLKFLSLPPTSL